MKESHWSMKCFLERGRQHFLQLFKLLYWLSNKSPSPYLPDFIKHKTTDFQPLSFLLFTHGKSLSSFSLEQILNISVWWEGGNTQEHWLPKLQNLWYDFHISVCIWHGALRSVFPLCTQELHSHPAGGSLCHIDIHQW